ncbi:substrate-binding domain-containing protein [Mesorhizobium sp. BR1-1-16]|uniref:substrate-binding domain-containing protein n=1 Tax=Mesorhizobium sp. BR1-1-16 TaxID=2876653 RepID=UPI001CCC2EB6|nr:substrate-binding domain-containing protein [Mesorhizobium sp. BR1-1-16]MBZ9936992.1 substrate-binding domain-containing protein [Mesorhizobium sp. BR1-1-16]
MAGAHGAADGRELRFCGDPNDLPFSNEKQQGFENRIARIVADELKASVTYRWWAQRRGFLRNTLNAGTCDLVMGIASNLEMLRTTRPYYRSGYVFVTRAADHLDIASLDDPRLRWLKVGVQLVGDDGANTPPAHALARRGIVGNLRGYPIYGNFADPEPGRRIVDAVANGEVNVALVWGPTAGYFARSSAVPLALAKVAPEIDGPMLPMVFDISMGVRKDDATLRREVDDALRRRRSDIDAVLAAYGVPRFERLSGTTPTLAARGAVSSEAGQ